MRWLFLVCPAPLDYSFPLDPIDLCHLSWSSYKIDHKRDKIGVFVSTVSTKVPFKVCNCVCHILRWC